MPRHGPATGIPDPMEALLREIRDEVRGLRSDLKATGFKSNPVAALSRDDRARLARLLPAIGGALGSDLFMVREVLAHESAALRVVLRGLNAKQVGRLLRRGVGQPIDGYLIQREGQELHAALWRVVQVAGFSGNGEVSVSPADRRSLR